MAVRSSLSLMTVLLLMVTVMVAVSATAPGQAQTKGQTGAGTARSVDADQPIDINADNLEIQQDKNLAIFTGNVIAVQGRIKLRAEQLRVWYRPSSEKSNSGDGNGSGGGDSTIIRIDAIDNVFVSSATETAQGDLGIYEVAEQRLTLTGTVILTRGENVLRGKKLVMNMATGQSRISGGRVHGRFVPPKRKRK